MTSPRLSLKVYQDLESLQEVRPAWDDLLAHYPAASIFSTWEWLAPWWRAFGSNRQLWVIAFFTDSAQLAALAPFSLESRRIGKGLKFKVLQLLGDGTQDSDNLDLPVRPGWEDRLSSLYSTTSNRRLRSGTSLSSTPYLPTPWQAASWNNTCGSAAGLP